MVFFEFCVIFNNYKLLYFCNLLCCIVNIFLENYNVVLVWLKLIMLYCVDLVKILKFEMNNLYKFLDNKL